MLSLILAIILGILFTSVASQNTVPIDLVLFGNSFSLPLYVLTAIVFLSGIFVSLIYHLLDLIGVQNSTSAQAKQVKELIKENAQLKEQLQSTATKAHTLNEDLVQTKEALKAEKTQKRNETIRKFFTRAKQSFS